MEPSIAPSTAAADQDTAPALWLVRHGESTWNVAGLAQGQRDQAELTERGLRQASDAASRFHDHPVRAIYASDLRRALQTAAAFAAVVGVPVRTDARLRERALGLLEGAPSTALRPLASGLDGGRVVDPDARPAGGESVREMYQRAAAFCGDLADTISDHGEVGAASGFPGLPNAGDVVIVAHGGTVRVLAAYLHGIPPDQMSWGPVENVAVVHIPDFLARLPRSASAHSQSPLPQPPHHQSQGGTR
jgi:2,3-bisphosphoglycerate-dependent phosphoglycerate mutase